MIRQYFRAYELLVDDEVLIEHSIDTADKRFKVTFTITHDFGGKISYCELSIFNLAKETSQKAFAKGSVVTFRAGYHDNIDVIFKGKIINALVERNGVDTVTKLICTGGSESSIKSIDKTLSGKTSVLTILKELASAMGYALDVNEDDFKDDSPYLRGKVLFGDPSKYLEQMSQAHSFDYIIENDRLVVLKKGQVRSENAFVINEFTGLEGAPEITEVGVTAKVRLNPAIKIGNLIDIQANFRTFQFSNMFFQDVPEGAGLGIYEVFKVVHTGDTHADEWTSTITGYRQSKDINTRAERARSTDA